MHRGKAAGLADLRVQPEISHQLVRVSEAVEIADRGDDGHGDRDIDAGHAHQPARVVVVQRVVSEFPIDEGEFLAVEVQLAQ